MSNKKITEGIRGAKEGVAECWDDMGGQTMTTGEGEQMSVTISMPGKNISVTSDSVEEIANILKLAGIEVGATSAEETPAIAVAIPGMGAEAPEAELPAMGAQTMGQQPEIEMSQEEPEVEEGNEFTGALAKAKDEHKDEFEVDGKEYEVEEGSDWKDLGKEWSKSTPQPNGDAGVKQGTRYGGGRQDEKPEDEKEEMEETALSDPMDDRYARIEWLMKTHGLNRQEATETCDYDTDPETWKDSRWEDEYSEGAVDESIRVLRQLAGIQEAQSAAQKAAFKAMIDKKKGTTTDNSEEEKEEEVEESAEEVPVANNVYGQGVYEGQQEYARILELAGLNEWANSPEGKADDKGTVEAKLPSNVGKGGGNSQFGQNRANGQGENPMSTTNISNDKAIDVEEAFSQAMSEYRKFVSESIANKK